MRHICRDVFAIVALMIERAKPIPKFPPGTQHPGWPAFVGESGPEIILRPGNVAIVGTGKGTALILPSGHIIPHAAINSQMLEKPIESMTQAINKQTLSDIMAKATKQAYSTLPSFAAGKPIHSTKISNP